MEQDTFVDLEEFDENEINLDEPPRSAIHYLQQVAVSRKRCAQVVKASIDPKILSNNKPSSLSEFENNKEPLPSCINAPPREWSYAKCDEFSWNRTLLQAKRDKYKKPPDIIYPNAGDYEGWRKFCLGNAKNSGAGFGEQIGASSASDEQPFRCGHPPTPAIVLNLSENRANCLVEHLVQIFLDKGYSKSLFQWFYAVLLVVEKPLLHDVCAALRAFVKRCRFLRSTIPTTTTTDATASPLADNNAPSAYEFSLFIALISIYFEQKDLADHQ